MIPGTFEYHAPETIEQAINLLTHHEDAKILAGGHSLLPMMKFRFADPAHLVDLNKIDMLRGIQLNGKNIEIGAMTTENQLIRSSVLQTYCPLLVDVAKLIADPQVRNRGTIGGDIAHGDPGNDHPAVMLALQAVFHIVGPNGERKVSADEFFLGTYWTALEETDILTKISIPKLNSNSYYGYNKLKRKTGDFATAGATVVVDIDNKGKCLSARISITNAAPTALRAKEAEDIIIGTFLTSQDINNAADKAMAICDPVDDLRGSTEYKVQMTGEMIRRSLRDAKKQAGYKE